MLKVFLEDMDLYHEDRTLVHSGTLARRQRNETDWHGWNDIFVALLNNYRESSINLMITLSNIVCYQVIFAKAETSSSGVAKYYITSRVSIYYHLSIRTFLHV